MPPSSNSPLVVHDVTGDGNCFFYALYGAADSTGNLERMLKCLPIGADETCQSTVQGRNQKSFTQCARQCLADWIMHGPKIVRDSYDFMHAIPPSALTDYGNVIVKASAGNFTSFQKKISDDVRTDKTWMEHLYIAMMVNMIEKCSGLKVTIHTGVRVLSTPDENHLVLVNVNYNHYKFVALASWNARRKSSSGSSTLGRPSNSNSKIQNSVIAASLAAFEANAQKRRNRTATSQATKAASRTRVGGGRRQGLSLRDR